MKRRLFGRRKSDRLILVAAIAAVLGLFWTYTQGCSKNHDNPTTPPVTFDQSVNEDTVVATTPEPEAEPVAPQGEGTDEGGKVYINVRKDGTTDVNNQTTSTYRGRTCAFLNGPHPQQFLGDIEYSPAAGQRQPNIPAPAFVHHTDGLCGEHSIQYDSGQIRCDDTNSNTLGRGLVAWEYGVYDFGECECEPGEWEPVGEPTTVSTGEWGEIIEGDPCYRERTIVYEQAYFNGCDRKVEQYEETETEIVDCPVCEPEWTPGKPAVEVEVTYGYGEWTQCVLDDPEDESETGFCPGTRSRRVFEITTTTTTTIYTNQCDERTRTDVDVDVQREQIDPETEPCRAECPIPEGHCFYNNRGDDGKDECMELPGFVSWNDDNHLCELEFPGVCRRDFHLNPGQSVEGCLKWTGGDPTCGLPE